MLSYRNTTTPLTEPHAGCSNCAHAVPHKDGKVLCACPFEKEPIWSTSPALYTWITDHDGRDGFLMLPREGEHCQAWEKRL